MAICDYSLVSGVVSAVDGGNFTGAFVSGTVSFGIGAYAQSVNMSSGLIVASTTVMGGAAAWATGGDFLQGAMQGMMIGLFNHAMHDKDGGSMIRGTAKCEVLPDGTYVAPEELQGVTVRMLGNIQLSTPAPPAEKPLESVSPEFGILFAGRAIINGLVSIAADGLHSIYRYYRWQNRTVQFGNNQNQLYHAFRHVDDMGLNRSTIRNSILNDLRSLDDIPVGKPFNGTIDISGNRLQYTIYKRMENGKYVYK